MYVGGNSSAPYVELGKRDTHWRTLYGMYDGNVCWKPRRQAVVSVCYFVVFVFMGCFIILSLFVGAVCGGMSEAIVAAELVIDKVISSLILT